MEKLMKKVFETVDSEGNKLNLAVKRPTPALLNEARRIHSKALVRAIDENEGFPRSRLKEVLKKTQIWTDEDQEKLEGINKEINRLESIVRKGKGAALSAEQKEYVAEFGMKKFARKLAIDLYRKRVEALLLANEMTQLDHCVAENIADNKMYDYLTSQCTVWGKNEGSSHAYNTSYFASYDDYVARAEEVASQDARAHMEGFLNDYGKEDWRKNLPEFQLLAKYGFVNDKLQLIDEAGNIVDEDGNPFVEKDPESPDETIADFEDDAVEVAAPPKSIVE